MSASTLSIFDDNLHPGGNNLITVQLYDKVVKGKKLNCYELKDYINSSSVIFLNGAILGIKIEAC